VTSAATTAAYAITTTNLEANTRSRSGTKVSQFAMEPVENSAPMNEPATRNAAIATR
jgi:hypothetical protein